MRISIAVWCGAAALSMVGCGRGGSDAGQMARLSDEFVKETLSFSPVSATQAGYHEHKGRKLDEELDDFGPEALNRQRDFLRSFRDRLNSETAGSANDEDRADGDLIRNQIELALLELDSIQNYRYNPTVYVETIGNAMFGPYVLDYKPKAERFRHIIARLNKVPAFVAQAKENLAAAPEVWNRVAEEENEGNIALIDKTLRAECPAELKQSYETAAATALTSLHTLTDWMKSYLAQRPADWRLGRGKYDQKFRYAMGTETTAQKVLTDAEKELSEIRAKMDKIAGSEGVRNALDRYAKRHATPDTYFDEAKGDLAEATEFVKSHKFVPLPPNSNLQVIPTPEFVRGIYAVGGFSPAPALEPKLGAFYWITPIPKTWARERIESKLREYNFYGLKILTVHEAMPGHYVQAEYANGIQPDSRRLLRAVYGSGPYVEGWAVYATEFMIEDGYYKDDPGMQLNWYKQLMRAVANTILDIRMQTMGMTEQQALDLMINQTFQEKEEATAKVQRAQLSSCQLPTYYVGWRAWRNLRQDMQRTKGGSWNESAFHQAALKEGAVSMDMLPVVLRGK